MDMANGASEEDRRPGRILASLAPQLMSQRIISSPSFQAVKPLVDPSGFDAQATLRGIARSRMMLPTVWGGRDKTTTAELCIIDPDRIAELLRMDLALETKRRSIQTAETGASDVDLLAGFLATVPSASEAKQRRRQKRAGLGQQALGLEDDELGDLKWRGAKERGLLTADDEREGGVGRRRSTPGGLEARKARKARRQTALGLASVAAERSSASELRSELDEIALDRAHLETKRQLLAADRDAVDVRIARFQALRAEIDRKMLTLKEEELELVDEEEGVLGRLDGLEAQRAPSTSRRRKGPAFLPSSHDALPRSTAFLTLAGHTDALTALDFSCPYGSLLTSSLDSTVRLWDLTNGDEVSRLKGHQGIVNCLQVEGSVAVTGARDHQLIVWDLEKADDGEEGAEVMRLSGHAGSVTALYLDGTRLVSGAEDRTLREWNIETGQVVSTLDVLWAMQHTVSPPASPPASPFTTPSVSPIRPRLKPRASLGPAAGSLEYLPPLDPSWEDSQDDFIGGLQHYGAALATGDRSAVIRLWDLRTGQSVRTLIGHTGAIRCLAFDETTLMSGGADQSLKIWDLRTGGILDTLRFDHPVTALQFDTRKIVFAAGENGVRVHNRTTLQQAQLVTNGHSAPVVRLRYDDTFLVSGSRDGTAKAKGDSRSTTGRSHRTTSSTLRVVPSFAADPVGDAGGRVGDPDREEDPSGRPWRGGSIELAAPLDAPGRSGARPDAATRRTDDAGPRNADTEVQGVLAQDDVDIAGLKLTGHTFGVATAESDEFANRNIPFDGLMGLAKSTLSNQKQPTPIESLSTAGLVDSAQMGFTLGHSSAAKNNGEATFGGIDQSKINGQMTVFDNVNPQGFWEGAVDTITMDGEDLNLAGRTAILDTGTSLMIAPPEDAAAIHAAIPGAKPSPNNDGTFTLPCTTTSSPSLPRRSPTFSDPPRLARVGGSETGTSDSTRASESQCNPPDPSRPPFLLVCSSSRCVCASASRP